MRPAIVHLKDQSENAFLVDLHSTVRYSLGKGKSGELALRAIAIKHLRAGEIILMDDGEMLFPRPTQHESGDGKYIVQPPMFRGFHDDAAIALLSMPLGYKTAAAPGEDFLVTGAKGFNPWNFLIAWTWSRWQTNAIHGEKWTLERRWQDIKRVGFPGSEDSFRKICSRLKLFVTE